jgi:hypothetical protein
MKAMDVSRTYTFVNVFNVHSAIKAARAKLKKSNFLYQLHRPQYFTQSKKRPQYIVQPNKKDITINKG